jgi:hypothetical protein
MATSLLHPFLHLSYPVSSPSSSPTSPIQLYVKGPLDACYVLSSFLFFVVAREVFMRCLFAPIARKWVVDAGGGAQKEGGKGKGEGGASSTAVGQKAQRKAAIRFAEQGWSLLYYSVYWGFGLVSLQHPLFTAWTRAELDGREAFMRAHRPPRELSPVPSPSSPGLACYLCQRRGR